MDTLLKETVNATVNSRYPGMAPEGRRQLEEILVRREVEKGELLLKAVEMAAPSTPNSGKPKRPKIKE